MGTTSEKLTYLNTTKEKIRDSINLTGANIGTSDTFRSYASKLKKGYIDIINNGIDTLYNNFPKVSGIGSNLSLTPTYEAPMKLNEIQGDTLQDGTPTPDTPVEIQNVTGLQNIEVCGKNFCNNVSLSGSNNDIFFYFNKGISKTITLSATINSATSGNSIYLIINGTSKGKIGEITGSANTKQSTTITFTNEIYEQIQNSTTRYLQLYKNNAGFTLPTDAQIENGSSNTDYEEYKSNTYEVNLGKNLLNAGQESYTFNANINNSHLPVIGTVDLIASTKYYISYNIDSQMISNLRSTPYLELNGVRYYQNTNDNQNLSTGRKVWEFTPTISGTYNFGYWSHTPDVNLTVSKFMISKSSDTSYSPYFTPIELNKIGDYQDRIYKDNDKWYVEKQIGKVVLDGSETYSQIDNSSYSDTILRFTTNIDDKKPNIGDSIKDNILSDKFTCKILNDNSTRQTNSIAGQNGLVRLNIFIDKTIIGGTDTNAFKTWLSTHNTEVLYVLNTPTTTEITNTELIEDLETLYTAKSQEGTTNISITSEDLEMILNVSALKGEV